MNIKKLLRNNKFRILGVTWDKEFELTGGHYSVSDIHRYFEYIVKKHEKLTYESPFQIYINKIQNRIPFNIKLGCYLELLAPETMKLLGSNERRITKDKNGVNVPQLGSTEVLSVHCSIVNNRHTIKSA